MNLVDGDLKIQGIGTVTYVSNDDVYIFGHPMDLAGNSYLPISRSYIYSVIPTSFLSFKIGASSTPLGSTIFDGNSAVYCKTGISASMIPVKIAIKTPVKSKTFNIKIVDNKYYFTGMLSAAVGSTLNTMAGTLDDKRMTLNFNILFNYQGKPYAIQNSFLYSFNPSFFNLWAMMMDLGNYFNFLYNNDLSKLEIKSIDLDIALERGVKFYIIQNVKLDKNTYYPGDEILIKFSLKEYRGGYTNGEIRLKIPVNINNGPQKLIVGNEGFILSEVMKQFPRQYQIQTIEDLTKIACMKLDPANISAGLINPQYGLSIGNTQLVNFPKSYLRFFYNTLDSSNPVQYPELILNKSVLDGTVFGSYLTSITIAEKPAARME